MDSKKHADEMMSSYMRECENHLSYFGSKVLNVIIQNYRTARNINKDGQYEGLWQGCNLGNNAVTRSNLNFPNINNNYEVAENDLEYPESLITLPDNSCAVSSKVNKKTIPKTTELLKSAHDKTVQNNTHFDITHRSDEATDSQPIFSLTRKDDDICFTTHLTDEGKQVTHEYFDMGKQVAWEDMVDSEMFKVDDKCNNIDKTQTTTENNVFDNTIKELTSQEIKLNESNKILLNNSNKVDLETKKVKKAAKFIEKKSKNNFLKRKYTKAVKKWLKNVDPTHMLDGIDHQADTNSIDENITIENLNNTIQLVEVRHKSKKMIQTQLTNDNGAMKFCKPKYITNVSKRLFGEENCIAEETSKVKTNKHKFIVPIKSQNLS